jgi:flavin-dependent dehydrogenase
MVDVIVAGAGPAGAVAALTLARAGARVVIVDRDPFPRDKLCGDTLNPGAIRVLHALGLTGGPLDRGWPLSGMRVTGPAAEVVGRYRSGARGLAVKRRDLDVWLLERAIAAGARFESGLVVREPLIDQRTGLIRGVVLARRGSGGPLRMPSILTIGADGRRSALATAAGLRREISVRRWAFGSYAHGVTGATDLGEMHIHPRWYVGVAPMGPDEVNVCLVTPPRPDGRTPSEILMRAIGQDPVLSERFARAEVDPRVRVLGPLGARVSAPGRPGLLLAGDAAGFVDPMTGDGLSIALQGAVLAAREAARVLGDGQFEGAVRRLSAARRRQLGGKLRFDRWMCRVVESPAILRAAARGARRFPGLIERAVGYAGEVP